MVYNIQTNIIVLKIISSKSSNMFLYLTNDWSQISKSGWRIIVSDLWWQTNEFPIALIEGIVIIGRIQLSTDVIRVCLKSHIPVFSSAKSDHILANWIVWMLSILIYYTIIYKQVWTHKPAYLMHKRLWW